MKILSSEGRQTSPDEIVKRLKSVISMHNEESAAADSKLSALPKAAVAIIVQLAPQTKELQMLLIKRNAREGDPWSGQMAFPGGRYSENDESLLETAIREVREEIGFDLPKFWILGALDDVVASSLAIRVRPYLALASDQVSVRINPNEVESFVWIPLSFFIDRRNLRPYDISRFGQTLVVPSYNFVGNFVIWGMTLRIIENLISKL